MITMYVHMAGSKTPTEFNLNVLSIDAVNDVVAQVEPGAKVDCMSGLEAWHIDRIRVEDDGTCTGLVAEHGRFTAGSLNYI